MNDYTTATQGRELGWDDTIENDSPEFITLPAGVYPYTVTGFERARYNPTLNAKLPPCPMAVLTISLMSPDGFEVPVKDKLYLHSSCEGFLCEFFTSIGQRKHGQRVQMDWSRVQGAHGYAKVGIRKYTTNNGEEHSINEIKRYLDPEDKSIHTVQPATTPASSGYAAPGAMPGTYGYTAAPSGPAAQPQQQTAMPGYNGGGYQPGQF